MKLTFATVPLGTLILSPLNARPRDLKAEDVDDLIPSIRALGLANPLTVHVLKKPKGKHGVVAGQRRWRALLELASDPAIDAAAIPVMIAEGTDAELRELSIHENEQREEMDEVEMLRAMGGLRKANPSISDEQLAINFGVGVDDVTRIMRLAALHPDILDGYEAGKLDSTTVRAFGATDDQARQFAVWQQVKDWPNIRARDVRQLLGFAAGYDVTAKLAIVGADALIDAGGKVTTDMFSDAIEVQGGDILDQLFDEKVEELKASYVASNPKVKLIASHDQLPRGQYGTVDYDLRVNTEGMIAGEHRVRWQALTDIVEEAERHLEPLVDYDVLGDDELSEDPTTWPLVASPAGPQLVARLVQARADLAAIVPVAGIPDVDLLGVYEVKPTGLDVKLWFPSREAAGLPPLSRTTTREAVGGATSAAERQRRDYGLTKDGMAAMMIVRRDMIRDQLCYDRDLALDFLLFTQGRTILSPIKGHMGPYLSGAPVGICTPDLEDTSSLKAPTKVRALADTVTRAPILNEIIARLKTDNAFTHPDPIEGFNLYRQRGEKLKNDTLALVAGASIRGADSYYSDPQTPRFIEGLAADYLGQNSQWSDSVTYNEAFFSIINHKKRVQLLTDWGQEETAKRLKPGESAAYCAKVYQSCMDVFLSSAGESETVRRLLNILQDDQDMIVSWKPDWFDPNRPAPLKRADVEEMAEEHDE